MKYNKKISVKKFLIGVLMIFGLGFISLIVFAYIYTDILHLGDTKSSEVNIAKMAVRELNLFKKVDDINANTIPFLIGQIYNCSQSSLEYKKYGDIKLCDYIIQTLEKITTKKMGRSLIEKQNAWSLWYETEYLKDR
ncbi:hypothetical protein A2229_00215 [Candidatus Peregrinibacteria bacterium RIFOXYA2_FULL_33_7]|nr:MAG: hypothetical protein A2229_00215 [Candidatus Peregrinibacteria bacterium RIFOXYA2_FULL_33_7]